MINKENENALKVLSRFALPPVLLGRCGETRDPSALEQCLAGHEFDVEEVKNQLRTFRILFPYLKTISEVSGKDVFSYEVAKAYWLGSPLLSEFRSEHLSILLKNFKEQGIPEEFIEELRAISPAEFIPMHIFQLLFLSNDQPMRFKSLKQFASDSKIITEINSCMIRPGKVTHINIATLSLEVETFSLSMAGGILISEETTLDGVDFNPKLLPGLKEGSWVAIHWNCAVSELDEDVKGEGEVDNLTDWTNKVVKAFNKHIKREKS